MKLTTDELFALGLEHTRILAAMIDNGRSWYLGRRRRRLEEMISSYFDPKRGLGIDYFRKTICHLANGGFKKVNMKSDATVAFRKGNEHVLALLREMEPAADLSKTLTGEPKTNDASVSLRLWQQMCESGHVDGKPHPARLSLQVFFVKHARIG